MPRPRDDADRDPPAHRPDGSGADDSLAPACGSFGADGLTLTRGDATERGHRACRMCYRDALRPRTLLSDGGPGRDAD